MPLRQRKEVQEVLRQGGGVGAGCPTRVASLDLRRAYGHASPQRGSNMEAQGNALGLRRARPKALKGRNKQSIPTVPFIRLREDGDLRVGCRALSGLLRSCVPVPRALPWATMSLPLRGEKRTHRSNPSESRRRGHILPVTRRTGYMATLRTQLRSPNASPHEAD